MMKYSVFLLKVISFKDSVNKECGQNRSHGNKMITSEKCLDPKCYVFW